MSISYGGHYDVRIRTKKDTLDKIKEVVDKVRTGYQWEGPGYWNCTGVHDDITRQFTEEIDQAKQKAEDPVVLGIYCEIDDGAHGFFGEYMNPIQEAVPDMEIAVEAKFDPQGSYRQGYAYKKASDDPLYFSTDKYGDLDFDLDESIDIFPENADWIPWEEITDSEEDYGISDGVLTRYLGEACDLKIPNGVKEIGAYAFENMFNIFSVEIPEGVTKIGEGAFYGCESMGTILIPESVVEIGEEAFVYCDILCVFAPIGSYAERYARENGIKFWLSFEEDNDEEDEED